jgi:N6-L-threonylcarbamoyladenine synthase
VILAFESSCDETAVAVFDPARGVLADLVHSQLDLHAAHGGVVPDLATREHLRRFGPLIEQARRLPEWSRITQVAVTRGPGLAACLAVGVAAARAVGVALGVPVMGVNHLRAHAWSPFMPVHAADPKGFEARRLGLLPHLGLIASGGNTILLEISASGDLREISSTRDDAAGEALDKGAKLLGLGYPGGPVLERAARGGRADAYEFPRGIPERRELDFSFSGLKTSLRYRVGAMTEEAVRTDMANLCASYQEAVVDALAAKTSLALRSGAYRSLGVSGGVSNNAVLRERLAGVAKAAGAAFLPAEPRHTGDNAAMIGFAAWADPSAAARAFGAALTVEPAAYL